MHEILYCLPLVYLEFCLYCVPIDSSTAQVTGKRSWKTEGRSVDHFVKFTGEAYLPTNIGLTEERRMIHP